MLTTEDVVANHYMNFNALLNNLIDLGGKKKILILDYNGNLSLKELSHVLFLFTGEHLEMEMV